MILLKEGKVARLSETPGRRMQRSTYSVSCKLCNGPVMTNINLHYAETVFDKHERGDHTNDRGDSLLTSRGES